MVTQRCVREKHSTIQKVANVYFFFERESTHSCTCGIRKGQREGERESQAHFQNSKYKAQKIITHEHT